MNNLRVVTPPTYEPVTLAEAREHLELHESDTDHDGWITDKIVEARESCEEHLERCLSDAEYEYRVDRFCTPMVLPMGDVGSVSKVEYIDSDGDLQELDTSVYLFDDHPSLPSVYLAYSQSWPSTRTQAGAVRITFHGRYSEGETPPITPKESIKGAMKMLIAHWFENRGATSDKPVAEIPLGVKYKLNPYRLGMGV